MAEETRTLTDLKDLKSVAPAPEAVPEAPTEEEIALEPKIDAQGRAYATGKRKNAIARVWIKRGTGRVTVNNRDILVNFARPVLRMLINQPFEAVNRAGEFDVWCTVTGGGLSGQAGRGAPRDLEGACAVRADDQARVARRRLPDPRFACRRAKKYGRAKARRSFQFSKR